MKLICRVYGGRSTARKEDKKLNIFTASMADECPQSIVVCTRYPITQKLLEEYLKSDQDLLRHRTSVLENADLYQFEQAYGGGVPQQLFYDHVCGQLVNESVTGVSSTFWVLGSEDSGREYTLRGGDSGEQGIMVLAVENLLHLFDMQKRSLQKQFKLQCSIFTVNENEMVDLVGNMRSPDIKQINIKSVADFKKLWKQSQFQMKNYLREVVTPTPQHTIVQLYIQLDHTDIGQVNFISYSEFSSGVHDVAPLRQFIKSVLELASNSSLSHTDVPLANKTFEAIYLLLNQSRFQNTTIIGQVSSTQSHFLEAFRTLQFMDEVQAPFKSSPQTSFRSHKQSATSLSKLPNKSSMKSLPQYLPKTITHMRENTQDERDFGIDIGNIKSTIMNKIDRALTDSIAQPTGMLDII